MELLSSGTAFYLNGQNLYGLKSTPELGGSREKKEVTNLLDTAHRYIAGLYKYDDLVFDFYYNSSDPNPNVTMSQTAAAYAAARAVEISGSSVQQKVEFPDGTYFTWSGQIATKIKRMDADGVMEFSIISIPNTPLTYSADNAQL
ncbi:MAG: hypothetical protein IJU82_00045 [Ruminiclostridium sp.]|jgi:hypothetical protein|nr:hypothetical protein [Ruminiclostridium sp.]